MNNEEEKKKKPTSKIAFIMLGLHKLNKQMVPEDTTALIMDKHCEK